MAYFARRPRRGVRHQWLLGFAIIAAATVFAWQTSGTRSRDTAAVSPQQQATSAHCEQFVTLAKDKFGENWKPHIDTRDPVCANAIEQAWARQEAERATAAAPQPVTPPPVTPSFIDPPTSTTLLETAAPTEAAATPVEHAAPAKSESRGRPDTYCLNVLWLARSKFGDDWKAHLTPREATKCAAYGNHLR